MSDAKNEKIPHQLNYVLLVDKDNPRDLLAEKGWREYLINLENNKRLFGDFKSVIWTNDKKAMPVTVKILEMFGHTVMDLHELNPPKGAYLPFTEIIDTIATQYSKPWSPGFIDALKWIILYVIGGIVPDLNYKFFRKFTEAEMTKSYVYDYSGLVENCMQASKSKYSWLIKLLYTAVYQKYFKNSQYMKIAQDEQRNFLYSLWTSFVKEMKDTDDATYFEDGRDNVVDGRTYYSNGRQLSVEEQKQQNAEVQILFKILNDPINALTFDLNTPLNNMYPLEYVYWDAKRTAEFLQKGANLNLLSDSIKENILEAAVWQNNEDVIESFNGGDIQKFMEKQLSEGKTELVERLLRHGEHLEFCPLNPDSALSKSIFHGYKNLFTEVIDQCNEGLSKTDKQKLVEKVIDVFTYTDRHNKEINMAILKILLDSGAKVDAIDIYSAKCKGVPDDAFLLLKESFEKECTKLGVSAENELNEAEEYFSHCEKADALNEINGSLKTTKSSHVQEGHIDVAGENQNSITKHP